MKIIGPDSLVFGVDDIDACTKYLADYGLKQVDGTPSSGGTFEALDGTNIVVRKSSDTALPAAIAAAPNIRDQIYGVADRASLDAVAAELSKDRDVKQGSDGIVRAVDDIGYPIGFQLTVRRKINTPPKLFNVPGQPKQRPLNQIAAIDEENPLPYTLSHVVVFAPDLVKAEKFYAERLQFRTVDVFTNLGPFMRPQGTTDHHTLFIIKAPHPGIQHFTFHVADLDAMLHVGWKFVRKGYKSHWGPGRHILGSNNFWYFNSPFGGLMEYDADMDQHDDNWKPRFIAATPETSQTYLFNFTGKWAPSGDKH